MKAGKKPLAQSAGEDLFDKLITPVTGPQAIAVSNHVFLSVPFSYYRISVQGDPTLARQVVEYPHIVVAGEPMYRDTGVRDIGDRTEQSGESSGNCSSVFKPEIEYITHQKDLRCIAAALVEPPDHFLFPVQALLEAGHSQMEVRGKVYALTAFQSRLDISDGIEWCEGVEVQGEHDAVKVRIIRCIIELVDA